jgi:hypothetical protein
VQRQRNEKKQTKCSEKFLLGNGKHDSGFPIGRCIRDRMGISRSEELSLRHLAWKCELIIGSSTTIGNATGNVTGRADWTQIAYDVARIDDEHRQRPVIVGKTLDDSTCRLSHRNATWKILADALVY